jgi:outer membrane protein TolC
MLELTLLVLAQLDPSGWTAEKAAARAEEVAPAVRQAAAAQAFAEDTASIGYTGFIPRLDLRGSYTRLSRTDVPPEFAAFFVQIPDSLLLRASLTVPVSDYFFTVLPAFRSVQHAARIAAFQADAEREGVALRAREAFYLYVRTVAAERVATDAVAQLTAYLADLEVLVTAGEGTPADLLAAKSRLAEVRVQRSAASGGVRVAAESLRLLLDLPPDDPITVGEDVFGQTTPAVPKSAQLLEEARRNRPEMLALAALAESADTDVRAANGQNFPRLSVVGNLDYANPNARQLPQQAKFTPSWDLSVVLSWSPNDLVGNTVQVARAELARARVDRDRAALEDALGIGAAQAASDYGVALETITAAEEGVQAAREAWRVRRELLGAGEATPSEALETETALRRAEMQQIDAHVAARLAYARVQHVIGRARAQGANQ